MYRRRRKRLGRIIYRIIDALSFSTKTRDLGELLNRRVVQSEEVTPDLVSHPGGFTRAFHKRRMGMAESYIRIAQKLDRSNYKERLHALKVLVELSFHAKTVSMPLNTARVQIEIMKEAVKNIHNRRRRLEMIADFSLASYGHEAVIRRFLRELKRVEAPEKDRALKDLDMGWDSHVHDNLSEGRKTPSQLILDAFIKGMSRVNLAYYDIPHPEMVFEAMEAGKILGIQVSIGIEFSTGPRRHRKHFLFLPPQNDSEGFLEFFDRRADALTPFIEGLEENRARRRATITRNLEIFNDTHLISLNQGYLNDPIFSLAPLRFEDLERIVPHGQYSRNHLGELLYEKLKRVLKRRVLALKVQYEVYRQLHGQETMTGWELERIQNAYHTAREQYITLTPGGVKSTYFSGKRILDYDSAFGSEADILPALKAAGGRIVFNRPLEQGMAAMVTLLITENGHIDMVELMNMRDSLERDPTDFIRLGRFVELLNTGSVADLRRFVSDLGVGSIDVDLLRQARDRYHQDHLIPLSGSAATGWEPQVPGMGFIRWTSVPDKSRRFFIQTHYRLPRPVSSLIIGKGERIIPENEAECDIYCLGKSGHFKPNLVGDEEAFVRIGPFRLWRYLNPTLKNLLRAGVGFVPAYLWIGIEYALVWLGITFFRNVFVDLVAFSGLRLRSWSVKDINFDNTSQSLFWTGFSVPVLGSVKLWFDYAWPFAVGPFFVWSKFFVICIANGLYIAGHNKLRHFDNRVIRANFFRSVLAWPFAAVFSPLGNVLLVPSIVQAKFWSDMVAALIEGTGKFRQKLVLRKRDLLEILPLLRSEDRNTRLTALLDILFIWARRQRGRTCLSNILLGRKGFITTLVQTFKKPDPAEKRQRQSAGREYLDLLLDRTRPQLTQSELGRFILEKYTDREVIVFTDFIDRNLVDLHYWLKRLRKKTAAIPDPSAEN